MATSFCHAVRALCRTTASMCLQIWQQVDKMLQIAKLSILPTILNGVLSRDLWASDGQLFPQAVHRCPLPPRAAAMLSGAGRASCASRLWQPRHNATRLIQARCFRPRGVAERGGLPAGQPSRRLWYTDARHAPTPRAGCAAHWRLWVWRCRRLTSELQLDIVPQLSGQPTSGFFPNTSGFHGGWCTRA